MQERIKPDSKPRKPAGAAAQTLLEDGPEAIGLHERDRDEQLAILRAAVELVTARTRRRPCAKRRRAA
jgi:hypothetical protein